MNFGFKLDSIILFLSTQLRQFFSILLSIFRFDGIVVAAPYPYDEYKNDGYFQRIFAIDSLLKDVKRVYIDAILGNIQQIKLKRENVKIFTKINPNTITIGFPKNIFLKVISFFLVWIFILKSRKIYFHSVYRLQEHFGICLHIPFIRTFFDIHGVVSNEWRMRGDIALADHMQKVEMISLKKATCIICVTRSMLNYFQSRFYNHSAAFILLPIMPVINKYLYLQPINTPGTTIVYSGGTAIWQQCEKMAKVIERTAKWYHYRIFINQPCFFKSLLSKYVSERIEIRSINHEELLEIYSSCHYGLILRKNDIVNKVACPTKLIEYLAYGAIPIVDSPDIGDFLHLGMKYIQLEDLENHSLPQEQERFKMASENFLVFERLQELSNIGSKELLALIQESI
jgi:hypothetical protein